MSDSKMHLNMSDGEVEEYTQSQRDFLDQIKDVIPSSLEERYLRQEGQEEK